jgi:hypothetical protein
MNDVLGCYADEAGRTREIRARAGAAGSVLVIDCDALHAREQRLVAHLGPDEPVENAELISALYLADASRGHCRRVTPVDFEDASLRDLPGDELECSARKAVGGDREVVADEHQPAALSLPLDGGGRRYRLEPIGRAGSIPDLRWLARGGDTPPEVLSLRDVIASLESYEPARTLTGEALARHRRNPQLSVCVLRAELRRVAASRIVLNRGLREAVLEAIRTDGLSASEIAIRCGRARRDDRGNLSGETSWLARRVGLAPESAASAPTPWIHSDVLALIARSGLGISPREVELG